MGTFQYYSEDFGLDFPEVVRLGEDWSNSSATLVSERVCMCGAAADLAKLLRGSFMH